LCRYILCYQKMSNFSISSPQEEKGRKRLGNIVRFFTGRDGHLVIPERRFVEAVNREAYQYQIGDFPAEWEAWIRKKREDPPTIEEILRNENYREEMKQKVKDVSEKDRLLQAKEYEEGLVAEPSHTQVKGHASAPYYGKKETSEDPTSTANTFQPGAWKPPGSDSSQNK
uniref:NDUF2 factor n=1 Tax=Malurus cyaneus samueli TaxID=2593467 RepID=A0A8C5TGU8_9PASS